ncbi:hypothetical protein JOE63_003150 [Cellulosimicrobium cellulans]|uniref:hypothetical protein n=1 Tax=Cellulosimicrobium cellulans TaxID=1710 RepID=UPI0019584482|nr:hypothetical protein [Cellulosimicrobium cellulans]MBM7820673.1 hypothetical protein [Cellulosimicrobium cellulans]
MRALLTAALGVLLGAVVALLGVAAPAAAHGGDVVISLGTDGEGGVSANLTWKLDGHPVEEAADVSVTAQSAAGQTVGPLTLSSASEGVGWYTSEPGVLAEGNWTLTATITHPSEATASAQVDVVPLPEPAPHADDEAAAGAEDGAASTGAEDDAAAADGSGTADEEPTGGGAGVWIAVAVVAVLLLAGGYVVVRRRSRAAAADESSDGKPRSLTSTSAR